MSVNHMMYSIYPQRPSSDAQGSPHTTFYLADSDLNTDLDQDALQVLPSPSNPPTPQDWEAHRAIFTQLYRTENRSLKEVMIVMADQHSFKATPRMFKKRVIDWRLNKNYKFSEREAVARVFERYKNRGDPIPPILLRGQPVKMHRIQRHRKIGQSVTRPFESVESLNSSVLENHTGRIQLGGLIMKHNKEIHLMGDMRVTANNLQEVTALFSIPLRQLLPPHELKDVELVIFQTNIFYECFAQSKVTLKMKGNTALESQVEVQPLMAVSPDTFAFRISAAISSLESSQPRARAGWRLLHEAMDMIRPMLASKNPYALISLLRAAWAWEVLLPPDLYREIWGQISKMASIVRGESDPLSKVCLAITHLKSKNHVYEIAVRLVRSIFEQTLGPYNYDTLWAKANHVALLMANRDFAAAECLQRMLISDSKKLEDKYIRRQDFVIRVFQFGCILKHKGDFTEAKKVFREALNLGRAASRGRFLTQVDIYCVNELVSMLAEDEYNEGEILLQEVLEKCLKYEHWGRYDWHTFFILGSLENHLKKQNKFGEAKMLRSQYPEAF